MKTFKSLTALALAVIILSAGSSTYFSAGSLKAPKLLSVKNAYNGVLIKWKKVNNATSYKIYVKSSKSFKKAATVKNALSFTHKGTKSKKTYTYKIKAFGNNSSSAFSNAKSVYRVKTPTLTVKNTSKGVKSSWTKINGATRYTLLYKKSGSSKFKTAYSGKKRSFTDDNLFPGTKYTFKVKAKIKSKSSAYSKKTDMIFLEQPTLSAEELLDMKGIHLNWSKVQGADGYRIYRSFKYKNSYKKIADIKGVSSKYYLDESVKNSKLPTQINSYKYYVKAYKDKYTSAKSPVKSEVYGYYSSSSEAPLYLTISKGQVYKDIHTKLSDNHVLYLFTWKSSNKKIVKVDYQGIITGVAKGKATITASVLYNDKVRDIKLIVTVQ